MKVKCTSFIHNVMKVLEQTQSNSSESESQRSKKPGSKSDNDQNKLILLNKCQRSKRMFKLIPNIPSRTTFNLFGFTALDEQSLQNPNHQEAYIFNFFRYRVVQKVEFNKYAIIFQLNDSCFPAQPNIEYFIEKFKAKGDVNFYEIAVLMEQAARSFTKLANVTLPTQKPQSLHQILNSLGNTMFSCVCGSNKIALSKALLTYLDYDLEEFSVEALKYGTLYRQIFSSLSYPVGIKNTLNSLKWMAQLFTGEISMQKFMELNTFYCKDQIVSKNHVKTYCDTSITFVTPSCFVHKIQKLYQKRDEVGGKLLAYENRMLAIEEQKQSAKQGQYKVLSKLYNNISSSYLKENARKTAGYMDIEDADPLSKKVKVEDQIQNDM